MAATPLSMTGYGRARAAGERYAVQVEVRTVNHRFLDLVVRLPMGFAPLEERVRQQVGWRLRRGRVEVTAALEDLGASERSIRVDRGLLAGYARALAQAQAIVAESLGQLAPLSLEGLAQFPGVFALEQPVQDAEALWPVLSRALEEALDQVIAMRRAEGKRLWSDVAARIDGVGLLVERIAERTPLVVEEYRRRLQERVAELLGPSIAEGGLLEPGGELEARLAAEVAIFADRCNITEELVRAKSHLDQLRQAPESDAPGRRADFLLQELFREANTMGSKANDAAISQLVIDLKVELEKMREQVQNLE